MPDTVTYTPENEIKPLEEAMSGSMTWHPTKEEKEIIARVIPRFENELLPAQQAFHQEWDDARKIYEAYIEADPFRIKETFRVPISHMVIDAALAEEMDAFPDLAIDVQDSDDKQKLPILNAAKKYALETANWSKVKHEALRIRRVYGWCAVRIYYSRETRIIKQRKPIKGDDGIMVGYEEVVDYPWDDIRLEVIDNPKRFLIDDAARDIEHASDCCLITDLNWSKFKIMFQHDKRYKNTQYVKPGADYTIDINGEVVPPDSRTVDESKRVRLVEYWNRDTDEYVVIANGILIRSVPLVDDHKELPFAVMHMYRRPHTFYSKGVPKLIESLEAAYNAVMQAEVRATKLAFPILRMDEDGVTDPRSVAPYPGTVIEAQEGSIELMQLGTVPGEVYRLKDKLEALLVWVTGVNYQQLFSQQESERVGIEALKKESMLARVNSNLRENESNFIVRLGELLLQDIMQYYTVPRLRRITPEDDLGALAKKKLRVGRDSIPVLMKDRKSGVAKAILELRRIPIEGTRLREVANEEDGVFSLMSDDINGNSYIIARPEYIRTHSKMEVYAVRPSAMGSSKEAKKLTMIELSNHAAQVNQINVQPDEAGQMVPTPIWDLEFLQKEIAEAYELPLKKAILSEADAGENEAKARMEEITAPMKEIFNKQMKFEAKGPPVPPAGAPALNATQQQDFMTQNV